jgi:hypothetical protein
MQRKILYGNCIVCTGIDTTTTAPILILRGRVGEEEREGFLLTTLDGEEPEAIGGRMDEA